MGMLKIIALLLVSACAACATDVPDAPYVTITTKDGKCHEYDQAIDIWKPLGFRTLAQEQYVPPCERNWYDIGQTECEIPVGLERAELSYLGLWGFTIREEGIVVINKDLVAGDLTFTVAHELGHVLLDTGEHLRPDQRGIMGGEPILHLTNADREFACRVRGFCY